MSNSVEDLEMLRLIKAFQKVRDKDARRMILRYLEDQVRKEETKNEPKISS
ncbi:hypothetical protein [Bradyrhizobium centrolobii]|uniref:hypothetical protein n=1 Tax=Bradyrhizobium centrolobii TaxID=1505087 RepID=UPI000B20FAD6|nr:hypothetical protein [Bradyrhizobium centrolobii]